METFKEQLDLTRKLTRPLQQLSLPPLYPNPELVDHEFNIAGNFFYVLHLTDPYTRWIKVRFNDLAAPQHQLTEQMGFRTPFERVHITTNLAAGGLGAVIVYGYTHPGLLEVIDNRVSANIIQELLNLKYYFQQCTGVAAWGEMTLGTIYNTVVGPNSSRKELRIQPKADNTGIIYLGYGPTVSANNWFAQLSATSPPFQTWRYTGSVTAIASAVGQKIGFVEFVSI